MAAAPLFAHVTTDFVVLRPSGEILAAANDAMQTAAPEIYATNQQGAGQAAATNADRSVNGSGNAIKAGDMITLWLTGGGFIPNGGGWRRSRRCDFGADAAESVQRLAGSHQYPILRRFASISRPLADQRTSADDRSPGACFRHRHEERLSGQRWLHERLRRRPAYDQKLTPQNALISTIAVK